MIEARRDRRALVTPPPAAPRQVTALARRRSWGERRVRAWWIGAAALLLLCVGWVGTQVLSSTRDRWLVRHGIKARALILEAGGNNLKGKQYDPGLNLVYKLEVRVPERQPYTVETRLTHQTQPIVTGSEIDLFVDRNDPKKFTDCKEISFRSDLIVGLIFLPLGVLCFIRALFLRMSALRAWRYGEEALAVAVDTRRSPIAPLSRIVRFSLRDSRDTRIYSALLPERLGNLEPGEPFWVVGPPGKPEQAVVAALYH